MMFKCVNKLVPDYPYLVEKFTLHSQIHSKNTRQSSQLNILRCHLTTGQRSFAYCGAKLWRALADNIKSTDSVNVFKTQIVKLISSYSKFMLMSFMYFI